MVSCDVTVSRPVELTSKIGLPALFSTRNKSADLTLRMRNDRDWCVLVRVRGGHVGVSL